MTNEPFLIVGASACLFGAILHFQFRNNYPSEQISDLQKQQFDRRRAGVNMSIMLLGTVLFSAAFIESNWWKATALSVALVLTVLVMILGIRDAISVYFIRKQSQDEGRLKELRQEIDAILEIQKTADQPNESTE